MLKLEKNPVFVKAKAKTFKASDRKYPLPAIKLTLAQRKKRVEKKLKKVKAYLA